MSDVEVKASPEGVPGALGAGADISGEELTFEGSGGTPVNGYLARSRAAGDLPAMIVIHEAGGLNAHIRDGVNRVAQLGYVTLGVDLYTREGGPPPAGDIEAMMMRTAKLGCIGFCMGGRYTLLFATADDSLDAAVDCWGGFTDRSTPDQRSTPPRPVPPLELAAKLSCPLLAAIGAEDQNPSPELGEQLRTRAAASGQEVKVDVYEDAGHAFFADYRPTYRPAAAAKLWAEIVPFLERHLHAA